MNIPTPAEFAKAHGHKPFPAKWDKWLSEAREAIISAQPVAGQHVSISEHPGKGTVINVDRPPATAGPGICDDLSFVRVCVFKSVTQNKYGWTNLSSDCGGGYGGLNYTSVSYPCDTCTRTLGTGDSVLRYYTSVSGGLTECNATHIALGGGCFSHHTGGGDCGCGGTGSIGYSMSANPSAGLAIDPALGNGYATIDSCSGSIHTPSSGGHTYTCANFSDGNSLFNNSLSDCGDHISLSSEYTTDQLIMDAKAAISAIDYPAYTDIINCIQTSLRNLVPGEASILITRVKYKFVVVDSVTGAPIPSPVTCTLKWRERTFDALDTCVSDEFLSTVIHAGDFETAEFEMLEPDGFNGTKDAYGDCCLGATCDVTTALSCATSGGLWMAPCDTACDPSSCA